MISTLNDGTDILMVRTLSVKNQKKTEKQKRNMKCIPTIYMASHVFSKNHISQTYAFENLLYINPSSVQGVDLIIQCTYFAVSSLNFGLHPWGSVPEIHLRKFSNHPEVSSMTSSVTSSPVKYVPKTNKNTSLPKLHEGYQVKTFPVVGQQSLVEEQDRHHSNHCHVTSVDARDL